MAKEHPVTLAIGELTRELYELALTECSNNSPEDVVLIMREYDRLRNLERRLTRRGIIKD